MIKTGDDQTPDHHQYKTKYERGLIYNKILNGSDIVSFIG